MLGRLLIKEWRTNLLELRFQVSAVLCVILGVVSVVVLRADLEARRAEYARNRTVYLDQAREYGSYFQLERQGLRVDRPPQSFQVLFYGVEKTPDRTAVVSDSFLPGFEGDLNTNPAVLLFPVADLLFVVGVVLSLLAFFLSYDAVAGERESGTLRLLLSYPVPRDALIAAKWLGGYLSLALPFLVALLIGAVVISLSASIPFAATDWQAFALTGVVSLLLLAVMFSLGLLVSVRAASSTTAILSLLALWVLLALVIPNLGPYVAELVSPVPAVGDVERQIALRSREISQRYVLGWRRLRGRLRAMGPKERSQAFAELRTQRQRMQEEVNQATAEIVRDFEGRLTRQTEVARMLTRVSPVASFVYANTDIGATGVRHDERLVAQLRAYQRQFLRFIDEQTQGQGGFGWYRDGGSEDDYSLDDLPAFDYRDETLGVRLDARLVDVLLLGLFALAFFMAAFVSFLRRDVQ